MIKWDSHPKGEVPEDYYNIPLGKAEIVREGKDVTILTYSRMRHHCIKAVEQLEADGINAELIDLISLKPFDMDTIKRSISKTNRVIIVEECMKTGGIGVIFRKSGIFGPWKRGQTTHRTVQFLSTSGFEGFPLALKQI